MYLHHGKVTACGNKKQSQENNQQQHHQQRDDSTNNNNCKAQEEVVYQHHFMIYQKKHYDKAFVQNTQHSEFLMKKGFLNSTQKNIQFDMERVPN